MERKRIGTGEVVLAAGLSQARAAITLGRGETVASRREELLDAASRLRTSDPLEIEIEHELDRDQLASLLGHAEALGRRIELRFSPETHEAIGSGEIIFSTEPEEPELRLKETGSIEFDQHLLEQTNKPLNVLIEGSALTAKHAENLVELAHDAGAPLRIGFSEP